MAIEADRCILKNLETGKHNRKKRGLQKRKPPEVSGERQSRVAGLSSVMTERDDLCGFPSQEAGRLFHRKGVRQRRVPFGAGYWFASDQA